MANKTANDYLNLVDEIVDVCDLPDPDKVSLMGYLEFIYKSELEERYSSPMFWIGMYIASASLVCILAMVADLVHGFRRRKLWFPCKYFRINAFFLTIIGVAMKLPVDLTSSMPGDVDQVAKLGSMAFMCTMMANLLPCLATMGNDDLLSNVTALCVLVVTIAVNVCIQIHTGVVSYEEDAQVLEFVSPRYDVRTLGVSKNRNAILAGVYVALLLVLLIIHVCSCLAILGSKKIIESRYKQRHDKVSKDVQRARGKLITVEKLQEYVRNHWIMAGSGSPQFITACFRTTSASGVICVLITVLHTLTMSEIIKAMLRNKSYDWGQSDYKSSMFVILVVQFLGVAIGTIAPLSRCFSTLSFKVSFKIISNHFKVFEVESYWTQKLKDWKHGSTKLPLHSHELKVVVETLKRLILRLCVDFQEGVVVVCKIIALIPFSFMICFLYWLLREKNANSEGKKDLRANVLQLEDEMELAERTLEGLSKSMNRLIEKGKKRQPKKLMNLILERFPSGFLGVQKFDLIDDHRIPSVLSKVEHQDSWSLPVVTLTTIAVCLPGIEKNEVDSLLQSVREGLVYMKLVEETLNGSDEYVSIRESTDALWKEVDAGRKRKWLENDLPDPSSSSCQVKTVGQIVEWFRHTAKDSFESRKDDSLHVSICADSMYRVTNTIPLTYHDNMDENSKGLFDHLSSMIADIIAACLVNLPLVLITKCHTGEMEKRENNVEFAAQLLGETKHIIKKLRDRDIPSMNPSDLPFIDKWRGYLRNP